MKVQFAQHGTFAVLSPMTKIIAEEALIWLLNSDFKSHFRQSEFSDTLPDTTSGNATTGGATTGDAASN